MDVDHNSKEPFYMRSMFGKMALRIRDRVNEMNDEAAKAVELGAMLKKNIYHSTPMFNYLVTHVLPYAPVLTETIFKAFNQPVGDDTTNNVENWIRILKRDYFRGEKNMKIGRLARAHEKLISGYYFLPLLYKNPYMYDDRPCFLARFHCSSTGQH